MKIGIFDSGLGGLIISRAIIARLPQYDYLYLGDTARVPYGDRSQEEVYNFTKEGVEYLFDHGAGLIILACNTASAEALRKIQQEYLPARHPGKRVLGVLIPAAEEAVSASQSGKIGVLATTSTVASGAFIREIKKLRPNAEICQQAAPRLVELIERNNLGSIDHILPGYLNPLLRQKIDTLILGCTHYPLLKEKIRQLCGEKITVISQDEIVPAKLQAYLSRHPEIENKLSREGTQTFAVTKIANGFDTLAENFNLVDISAGSFKG